MEEYDNITFRFKAGDEVYYMCNSRIWLGKVESQQFFLGPCYKIAGEPVYIAEPEACGNIDEMKTKYKAEWK